MSIEPYQIFPANLMLWILNGSLSWTLLLLGKPHKLKSDPKSLKAPQSINVQVCRSQTRLQVKDYFSYRALSTSHVPILVPGRLQRRPRTCVSFCYSEVQSQ